MMAQFLSLCADIGCPISSKKMVWASSVMVFLGTLLDGQQKLIAIPIEKIIKAINLRQWAINKKKVTMKFVQQLTGTLNFLNKAILPGRAFMRGMYGKLKLTGAQGQLLKPHHHVHLGSEFVQDCHMWLYFLTQANSRQQLPCRPFTDFDELVPWQTLQFFLDTSISSKLGFGATFDDQWIAG